MLFSTCIGRAITVKKHCFDDMRMVIGILASRESIVISSQQIKKMQNCISRWVYCLLKYLKQGLIKYTVII